MQPYVIKQGDFLAQLAYKFGFDADAVWNDPKNADLRQLRSDPNILLPADVLYIPDQVDKKPDKHDLTTGSSNDFVSDAPTVPMTIRFKDDALASQGYAVTELPQLTGLTTTGDGTATFSIPVTLQSFTIEFAASGAAYAFDTAHLDPVNTRSGVVQRLQNLGYIDPLAAVDTVSIEELRAAVLAFKATAGGDGSGPDSSDSSGSGASSQGDAASGAPSAPSSSQDAQSGGDDAVLTDDGQLDDDTSKQLVQAHGC